MKITAQNAQKTAAIISERLESLNVQIANLKGSDNPQVIFLVKEANSERLALEAVLKSLHGDSVLLNVFQRAQYYKKGLN